jgi:cytochrome c
MSFEANKIAAAILVAIMLAMVSGILAEKLIHPTMLAKNAYQVAGAPEEEQPAAASQAPAGPEPIGPLLASANAADGKNDTKVCTACHTFDKGGPTRVGPNLYGIMGDEIAHDRNNFAFSDALKKAGQGKTWTPDLLNEWLFKPQNFAKGTKMTFVGMPKTKERADVIAFLNSLSDSPKPLASEEPAKPAAPAPAAGGAAAPAAPAPAGAKPATPPAGGAAPPAAGAAAPPPAATGAGGK